MKPVVLILGASGMLGSMVVRFFSKQTNLSLRATVRDKNLLDKYRALFPRIDWRLFDACFPDGDLRSTVNGCAWIINAIGITKPYVHDGNSDECRRAIEVNAVFPYRLGMAAIDSGSQVIQIATDCVYSGEKGDYVEADRHHPLDVYGKTKSLGEYSLANTHHLRCSIIGPELGKNTFLLEWFLRQPNKATVNGFTNHRWNGITTLEFARICHGVITTGLVLPGLQHVIPADIVTKAELLNSFRCVYNRADITIDRVEAKETIDRTLGTADCALNNAIWRAAGYAQPPSITSMMERLVADDYRTAPQTGTKT